MQFFRLGEKVPEHRIQAYTRNDVPLPIYGDVTGHSFCQISVAAKCFIVGMFLCRTSISKNAKANPTQSNATKRRVQKNKSKLVNDVRYPANAITPLMQMYTELENG